MNYQTKILVIDDDQRLGRTIKNILSSEGYDVCYANNGALGIQKAFEYTPDLVLCDIRMDPIDGYQVFNVLKESSLIEYTPFIFLTGNSEMEDIRFGMDLGADDYFVKPFNNDDLIRSIETRLTKFKKIKDAGRREFKALFKLSPNGIFLFNGSSIIDVNPALLKVLEVTKEEMISLGFEKFFDSTSLKRMEEKIQRCLNGISESFNEKVTLIAKSGRKTDASIFVSAYEKFSGFSLMIGLVTLYRDVAQGGDNESMAYEVVKMLKRENITITHSLGEKLTEIFKTPNVTLSLSKNKSFFSKRETQVLCLSMEGLPMKIIADRLSISDRTVEKHRAKLMEKTGANNIVDVIVYALRNNLVDIKR